MSSSPDQIRTSILVPFVKWVIKILSLFSLYDLARRFIWKHHERMPFWFAESYVLGWLFFISLGFILFPDKTGVPLKIISVLAIIRLVDLMVGTGRIIFVEREHRSDEFGHYILVRDVGRWVILIFLNLAEITIYFAIFYYRWGEEFQLPIYDRITAVYQSLLTFTTLGYGEIHAISNTTKLLVVFHLVYFLTFILLVLPVVFSAVRTRPRTAEKFGETETPDL